MNEQRPTLLMPQWGYFSLFYATQYSSAQRKASLLAIQVQHPNPEPANTPDFNTEISINVSLPSITFEKALKKCA